MMIRTFRTHTTLTRKTMHPKLIRLLHDVAWEMKLGIREPDAELAQAIIDEMDIVIWRAQMDQPEVDTSEDA